MYDATDVRSFTRIPPIRNVGPARTRERGPEPRKERERRKERPREESRERRGTVGRCAGRVRGVTIIRVIKATDRGGVSRALASLLTFNKAISHL